jgi:hypothetical protein
MQLITNGWRTNNSILGELQSACRDPQRKQHLGCPATTPGHMAAHSASATAAAQLAATIFANECDIDSLATS